MTQEFLFSMAEREWPDGRFTDRGRRPTATAGAIDDRLLDAIEGRLRRVRWTARDVEAFVGAHFSAPKAHVFFDPPAPVSERTFARRAAGDGLVLDRRTTLLYRASRGYIAGEPFALPAAGRAGFRRLADRRAVDATIAGALVADPAARALLRLHRGPTQAQQPRGLCEAEGADGAERGVLAQAVAGDEVALVGNRHAALLLQHAQQCDGVRHDRGLRVLRQRQRVVRPFAHDPRQVLAECVVDFLEHRAGGGAGGGEIGAHADLLATLPREDECAHYNSFISAG